MSTSSKDKIDSLIIKKASTLTAQSAATRARLIATAERLFAERGIDSVTVAGVVRTLLYPLAIRSDPSSLPDHSRVIDLDAATDTELFIRNLKDCLVAICNVPVSPASQQALERALNEHRASDRKTGKG